MKENQKFGMITGEKNYPEKIYCRWTIAGWSLSLTPVNGEQCAEYVLNNCGRAVVKVTLED